jgi:hypothetical protein
MGPVVWVAARLGVNVSAGVVDGRGVPVGVVGEIVISKEVDPVELTPRGLLWAASRDTGVQAATRIKEKRNTGKYRVNALPD